MEVATVGRMILDIDVLTAARQRIAWTFDTFPKICVSFSGGKDSTVMLHLVMEAAIERGRKVAVLFMDWEAQYKLTIDHVAEMFDTYAEHIEPWWVALPMTTTNACSQVEPEWTCWDPAKRAMWVREPPANAITDPSVLPWYYPEITFEHFVERWGRWYAADEPAAQFVGIRTAESLNRWRAIARKRKSRLEGKPWTAWKGGGCFNVYPIYDWLTADVWTYFARTKKPYNRIYDRMHEAGVPPHNMRICEPYGDEQRRGLWLFHAIEPQTWAKVCARVAGANSGALYAGDRGNILGNQKIDLPEGHTWQSFAMLLLDTMPHTTAEHYRDKISRYIWYCTAKLLVQVPDEQPNDTGSKDVPSWRRICKVLLRNDYWCQGLSFSAQKPQAYERYKKIMRKNRATWGIL